MNERKHVFFSGCISFFYINHYGLDICFIYIFRCSGIETSIGGNNEVMALVVATTVALAFRKIARTAGKVIFSLCPPLEYLRQRAMCV